MANASDFLFDTKDSIVEGKDTAFDADEDEGIEDLFRVDTLRRKYQSNVHKMPSEKGARTLRNRMIRPG